MLLGDLASDPLAASCTDRTSRWSSRSAPPPREAMVVCRSEICATIVADLLDRRHRRGGVALDRLHPAGDVLGRLRRLLRQLLDLVGDDGEALAGLAGPRRLDRRVQRQQVRLLGDARDHLDDVADLGRGLAQLRDGRRRRLRGGRRRGRRPRWPPPRSWRSPGSRHPSARHRRRRSARCARPPPRRWRRRRTAPRSPPRTPRSAPRTPTAPPTTPPPRRPSRRRPRHDRRAGSPGRRPATAPIRPELVAAWSARCVRVRSPAASASVTSCTRPTPRAIAAGHGHADADGDERCPIASRAIDTVRCDS